MKRLEIAKSAFIVLGLFSLAGAAFGQQAKTIQCPRDSIQGAIDSAPSGKSLTLNVVFHCEENVTITRDDVAIVGGPSGAISGTVNVVGAHRIVIRDMTLTGPGAGLVVTDGGTATVEDSRLETNGTAGVIVTNRAHAGIFRNVIRSNGQERLPSSGRGVLVNDGGSAEIVENIVEDNRSDGIGVFDDAYARITGNLIQRNGRPAPVFDAGVQVGRARVRANGNVYRDNPYAAIEVFNDGSYRTGTFLNSEDAPDNAFPFEEINAAAGGVAADIGQASYLDLRQVIVRGTIFVGRQSMLQVRGDNVDPDVRCSEVDEVSVFGFNSGARLQFTKANGPLFGLVEQSIDECTPEFPFPFPFP